MTKEQMVENIKARRAVSDVGKFQFIHILEEIGEWGGFDLIITLQDERRFIICSKTREIFPCIRVDGGLMISVGSKPFGWSNDKDFVKGWYDNEIGDKIKTVAPIIADRTYNMSAVVA